MGCLLALVRAAWGDPDLSVTLDHGMFGRGKPVWHPNSGRPGLRYLFAKNEADALVAALEAAP